MLLNFWVKNSILFNLFDNSKKSIYLFWRLLFNFTSTRCPLNLLLTSIFLSKRSSIHTLFLLLLLLLIPFRMFNYLVKIFFIFWLQITQLHLQQLIFFLEFLIIPQNNRSFLFNNLFHSYKVVRSILLLEFLLRLTHCYLFR